MALTIRFDQLIRDGVVADQAELARLTTADYEHEMSAEDHVRLLRLVKRCAGKVLLSGYPSDLYDNELAGWRPRRLRDRQQGVQRQAEAADD